MKSLYEKYRPQKLSELVGQRKAVAQVKSVLRRGWGGRAYWISGDSGTGKTTLARIIASHGADRFFVEEFSCPAVLMERAVVDHIERSIHLYASGKGGRAFIVNEANGLHSHVIRWLLTLLEQLPSHVVFIFTTTRDNEELFCDVKNDAQPLLSRCIYIELANNKRLSRSFAEHCKKVAKLEKLDGKPLADYITLAESCRNNCRMMLQRIEGGAMRKGARL